MSQSTMLKLAIFLCIIDLRYLGYSNNYQQSSSDKQYLQFSILRILFHQLIQQNQRNFVTKKVLQDMFDTYQKQYKLKLAKVTAKFVNLDLVDTISTTADGYYNDKAHGTSVNGFENDSNLNKILVSGARGAAQNKDKITQQKISSLGLSEMIEKYRNGITAAYATINSMEQFYIDATINEDSEGNEINENFEWELSKSRAKKFLLYDQYTAMGVTKFYRLLIGSDYIRFIETDLTAGATAKIGKTIHVCGNNICLLENIGYFTSENQTTSKESKSAHKGYLKVQKQDGFVIQMTEADALVNKDITEGSTSYTSIEKSKGSS